jgi:hypothetical protein
MPQLKIDGDLPIDGTKTRCEQKQREGFRLKSIQAQTETALGQTVKENVAEFDRALAPDILNVLNFVPAQAGDQLESIKQAQSGWTFICDAPKIFVQGNIERRVVFGKKSA